MKRRVDAYGEWHVLDASSLNTSIDVDGIDAMQWPVYRGFRRDAIAIGAEALLDVIGEAFKTTPDLDWIEADDDEDARARIADLEQLELITCVRIGFTLRDGWVDAFESEAHRWQGSTCPEEHALGTRAMRIITDCRIRFELSDRLANTPRIGVGVERAKELIRRALPCTSDELNGIAAAHSIGAKTMQRARRALRLSRAELRNEHGRVTGYRWTA